MPGRLILSTPIADVADQAGADDHALSGEPPRFNVSPGQDIVVLREDGTLRKMRWGIIPVGRVNARGRPVMETIVNARGETVFDKSAFEGVRRCIVPADGWYEWTGEKRRKTAWRIDRKDGGLLWFAAIWDVWVGPGGIELPQVATITCEPSDDVRAIHDRMGVILSKQEIGTWTSGSDAEARQLVRPLAAGTLNVAEAIGVDWNAP